MKTEYKKVNTVDSCKAEIDRVTDLMTDIDLQIKTMINLVSPNQLRAWRKYRAALNKEKKYYELRLDLLQ